MVDIAGAQDCVGSNEIGPELSLFCLSSALSNLLFIEFGRREVWFTRSEWPTI
jgi:hypothetical protein